MKRANIRFVQIAIFTIVVGLFSLACGGGGSSSGGGSSCSTGYRLCVQPGPSTCCPSSTPYYCPSRGSNPCLTLYGCGFGHQCPGNCYECRP